MFDQEQCILNTGIVLFLNKKNVLMLNRDNAGDVHLAGVCVEPWLFIFPCRRSRHGHMSWEPWQKDVRHAMEATAKRRQWQNNTLGTCHGVHRKTTNYQT